MSDPTADNLRQAALNYHEFPKPGKLEVRATKPLAKVETWPAPIRRALRRPLSKFKKIRWPPAAIPHGAIWLP